MKVRVLGCSGSIAQGSRTTSFLLDHDVLIDAGTGVGDLTLDEMAQVEHILVSHSHLDHILSIGLLADSVLRRRRGKPPIRVHALEPTMAALRMHIFNGAIWPDFSRLPTVEEPVLEFRTFKVGHTLDVGHGRRVEALPARHTVPAVGFAVRRANASDVDTPAINADAANGAWVFSGDTGPNDALWAWIAKNPTAHLVVETAFSDDEAYIAKLSQHLCPSMLASELAKLPADVAPMNIHITHIKPGETDAVMRQVQALGSRHTLRALQAGDEMQFN